MQRLRFYDMRLSDLPNAVGLRQADVTGLANYVNSAQRRLLFCKEAGDEGWNGTFAEIRFTITQAQPYATLPREIARLEQATVSNEPVPVGNPFVEYLQFGNGRLPKLWRGSRDNCIKGVFARNNAVTFFEPTVSPFMLRVYSRDSGDTSGNKRVLFQGVDSNGTVIRSQSGIDPISGIFVVLGSPFTDAPVQFTTITGIQKDATVGEIVIMQVDPATGAENLLLTMQPGETTASYRRYYFNGLPANRTLAVTAIAKMDLIPVRTDTDYLLFQNPEAIIEECSSIRYSRIDGKDAKEMSAERHMQAVRLLNGEMTHYFGKDTPAVSIAIYGSARLERQKIGTLI